MLALSMQACAIAPGMTMSEPAELPDGEVVRVQPLTNELLSELDARRESDVREIAEESLRIAASIDIYTNDQLTIEEI